MVFVLITIDDDNAVLILRMRVRVAIVLKVSMDEVSKLCTRYRYPIVVILLLSYLLMKEKVAFLLHLSLT